MAAVMQLEIDPAAKADIDKCETQLARYLSGELDEDVFGSSASTTASTANARAATTRWSG